MSDSDVQSITSAAHSMGIAMVKRCDEGQFQYDWKDGATGTSIIGVRCPTAKEAFVSACEQLVKYLAIR